MENISYIGCVILGIIIHIVYDMSIDKREWRQTCIEVELNQCCKNAYDFGFEMGKRKMCEEFKKGNDLI